MSPQVLEMIFGDLGANYISTLNMVCDSLSQYVYEFIPIEEFKGMLAADTASGMKIYWSEMLMRAHLAGCMTLVRIQRWTGGMIAEAERGNFLAFAGAARSLIESVADSFTALYQVPHSIADNYAEISRALSGAQDKIILSPELEEALIHFSHGRKVQRAEEVPDYVHAKATKEYIHTLERADKKTHYYECYQTLCEIVHPGYLSIFSFVGANERYLMLDARRDKQNIEGFCVQYRSVMKSLLVMGMNPAMLTLKVLNQFKLKEIQTVALDSINLDWMAAWRTIRNKVEASHREPNQ